MIAGCGRSDKVLVDLSSLRCPPVRASDARALRQSPAPPPEGAITRAKAQEWIDGLGAQVRRMSKAGERVMWQYDRCRAGIEQAAG